METIELTDQLGEPYVFEGELISEYDTQTREPEPERPRWLEMALYRHAEGGYVLCRVAFSLVYHRNHECMDTGVKTAAEDLPDDVVPCSKCRPVLTDFVYLEDIRHNVDRCSAFKGAPDSVMQVLTLYRPGTKTPFLSQPARRLLELAEENDEEIRRLRRGAA